MLVSKIKPCMSKYKHVSTVKLQMAHYISYSLFDDFPCYTDTRSNSRANTCVESAEVRGSQAPLFQLMYLLESRTNSNLWKHDNCSNCMAFVPAIGHSNFCPISCRW